MGRVSAYSLGLLVFLTVLHHTEGQSDGLKNMAGGMEYLMKYGYISEEDKKSGALLSFDYVTKAIREFQRFAGLRMTGKMDRKTKEMMNKPRCGVKDSISYANKVKRRRRRYALHGSKWSKKDLTYRISKYGEKISKTVTDREVQRAFDEWSKVTPLTFTRKDRGTVDIDIRFDKRYHGDNNPFDGRGQTLAHAYFPRYGGDAHFDDDEPWTINDRDGINFFQVATHEFGHSLGLSHSDVYSALMAPFYKGYTSNFRLGRDDVDAIQALYGTPSTRRKPATRVTPKPTKVKPVRPPKPTKPPIAIVPEACRDSDLDAITTTRDGTTYAFKGKKYYRLNKYGIDKGYPRPISWDWKGVTGPIDAALTWDNGYTYLFKGDNYWKFVNSRKIYGPNKISEGFDGIPGNIDAAMVWSGNGKTYFFKDDQYWRYSGRNVDRGYPRSVSKWRGIPKNITTAFRWTNGRTYFFTGKKYYRYNDQLFTTDSSYPRSVATWWLGCPKEGKAADIKDPNQSNVKRKSESNPDEQWLVIDDTNVQDPLKAPGNGGCRLPSPSLASVFLSVACVIGRTVLKSH